MSNEPEEEEEGTAVDVNVDVGPLIAGSVETPSPEELPADGEPSTSRLSLRAPMTSLPGGALRGSRHDASLPAGGARVPEVEATEDSSVSLMTPRFDSNALASQLVGSGPTTAEGDDDETGEIGTSKREPVRDFDEATVERLARPDPDDEETLDPRAAVSAAAAAAAAATAAADATGEDETTSRRLPLGANDDERKDEATPGFPAMRPRFDSEAAGQWPPWHAQPEEARAQLRGVVSPVASGTEVLPRNTVEEAFRMLASPPPLQPAPQPPAPQPQSTAVAARDLLAHRLDEPAIASKQGAPRASGSAPGRPVKRGVSPFVVFLFAFLFTAGIFGGLVATRRVPLFDARPAAANATTPAIEATEPATASNTPLAAPPTTSASVSAPAAPAASTSVSVTASSSAAPSTSASAARPKTKGAPRRGKTRP